MLKSKVSYQMYEHLLERLIEKVQHEKVDAVYGLPRGGLPIAVHVSHHLCIPMMMSLNQFDFHFDKGRLLVVDDIVDRGTTYLNLIELADLKAIDYVTSALFYKPCSVYKPDYLVEEVQSDLWVVFPWESIDEKCEVNGTFQGVAA